MPELPDIDVYVEKLAERIDSQALMRIRINNPFLLCSVLPPGRNPRWIGHIFWMASSILPHTTTGAHELDEKENYRRIGTAQPR
jgi:hypothetical protein